MATSLERPSLPTRDDCELAAEASRHLSRAKDSQLRLQVDGGPALRLPASASRLLYQLLTEMAQGNAVTVIPVHAELTTQEAADYLNVSRPFLVGLLEAGKIRHHKIGTHRRIKFSDLQAYCRATETERQRMMDELAAQAQELGMGY